MRNRQKCTPFMITQEQLQGIVDALDVAAKDFPIKALAGEIFKGESTLRGELNGQPGHKLGLTTALLILCRTGDLEALDRIEETFGRVAFRIPETRHDMLGEIWELAGRLAKEFGEHVQALGGAVMDGQVDPQEAKACLRELKDVLSAAVELQAHLRHLAGEEE